MWCHSDLRFGQENQILDVILNDKSRVSLQSDYFGIGRQYNINFEEKELQQRFFHVVFNGNVVVLSLTLVFKYSSISKIFLCIPQLFPNV